MPETKGPSSLFVQVQKKLASMVQTSLVRLDSVWSSGTHHKKSNKNKSPNHSPKTSPISYRMAGVIIPPLSDGVPQQLSPGRSLMQVADPIDLIRWTATNVGVHNTPYDE